MKVNESVRNLLAKMKIVIHPDAFTLVSIDKGEETEARHLLRDLKAFSSVTFDVAEVSLVVRADEWSELRGDFRIFKEEGPYRLITFDIVLDLSVVGFMAVVSERLAKAGISIYALSTFLRDHILVKERDIERAEDALRRLVEECSRY